MASSEDFMKELKEKKMQKRQEMWEKFFKKYSFNQMAEDKSYNMGDVPEEITDDKMILHFSNKVSVPNPSEYERKLIDQIEFELQSDLNELVLKREMSKILCDYELYQVMHHALKHEIRRVKKFCSKEDIEHYIKLCVEPRKDVKIFIEKLLKSNLNTLMIIQEKCIEDGLDCSAVTGKIRAEWANLTEALPEECIVIYCVNVVRKDIDF